MTRLPFDCESFKAIKDPIRESQDDPQLWVILNIHAKRCPFCNILLERAICDYMPGPFQLLTERVLSRLMLRLLRALLGF